MTPEERARVVVDAGREQLLANDGTTRHYNAVADEALRQIKAAIAEERRLWVEGGIEAVRLTGNELLAKMKEAVAERTEECAKLAEDIGGSGGRTWNDAAQEIAATIRRLP